MPLWDVFHSDRLEAEKSLTTEDVRRALARGDLGEDDLIRPAGESRWTRIGDAPEYEAEFRADAPTSTVQGLDPAPRPPEIPAFEFVDDEDEDDSAESDLTRFEPDPESLGSIAPEVGATAAGFEAFPEIEEEESPAGLGPGPILPAIPDEFGAPEGEFPEVGDDEMAEIDILEDDDFDFDGPDPLDEDEEAAEFTLSRGAPERVEELDLAAMVDVAFQLVLFFLVTAQVLLYKTLEVPRPNEDKPPEAAAQGRSKSIDELEKDYILVEVDAAGGIKVDRQPVASDRRTLVEALRSSREATQRGALLLSADSATRHENAVLVFDVANEIDLKVAIAQPSGKK